VDNNNKVNPPNQEKQYDRAIELIKYYAQLLWLVYSAFLISETVLLGVIATTDQYFLIIIFSFIGLALTDPWWASFKYNHTFYLFYIHLARGYEPEFGKFITLGGKLSNGGYTIKDEVIGWIFIPTSVRRFLPSKAVLMIIYAFAVIYFIILFKEILSVICPFFCH